MPDNDANRTKSPEELELEKQLALAKLKNSITQEQRGQFNAPNVAALQGNITSEGTFIESRILARRTLMEAFDALGKNIVARLRGLLREEKAIWDEAGAERPGADKPGMERLEAEKSVDLILYNAADIPYIELYAGLRRQVEALDAYYTRVNEHARSLISPPASKEAAAESVTQGEVAPQDDQREKGVFAFVPKGLAAAGALVTPAPMLAGYAVGAALRTAADLASLFRVDTDYKNFDLPIDDTALAAEFRKVIPQEWKLWHPAQFPVETACGYDRKGSDLLDALARIEEKNAEALSLVATVNDKGALDGLNAANTIFTQIHGLLTCVDGASKTTTMSLLLRAERLIALMKKEGTYVVRLVAVSRGSNKITKWIWSSAKIRHSAGTELNCLVFAPSGEVVFADTQLRYTPYRLPSAIEKSLRIL